MTEPVSVLVVDDNEDLLETFSLILKGFGYRVDTAGDGFSAVNKFQRQHFDVILMDIVMPGIDGVETFRRMREISPGARVILMTAYYEEEELRAAVDDGVYQAVHKPIDIARLAEMIQEATLNPPVLIVDDDVDFCKSLARTLEVNGYRVEAVTSGEEAIRLAQEKPFQIAFVDVKMRFMDGLETYLRLKEINPQVVAVMMTGYRDEVREQIERALSASATTCLYKPFDPREAAYLVSLIGGRDGDKSRDKKHTLSGR